MSLKESEQTEFKKTTSELKEGVISIASILNKHQQGKLYFGLSDEGRVIGQDVTANTLRQVSRAISENIEPKIFPKIEHILIEGKDCICVTFSGEDMPYFAYGRAYLRVADEDRKISALELRKMFVRGFDKEWEKRASDKTFKDVGAKDLRGYIKKANDAKRISFRFTNVKDTITKLHLIKEDRLINAADILFCKDNPFEVQAAVFAGKDKLTFLDIRQLRGNLFSLKEQSNKYLIEHMDWKANLSISGREEIPEIPLRALEEAVINFLCHRDYSNHKNNEIAFYKDRIEIYNPGKFPEEHSPQEYIDGKGESILRNPIIANALFLSNDIERWGSGIKRIHDACKEAGVEVKFENTSTGFKVIFYRKEKVGGVNGGLSGGLSGGLKSVHEIIINSPGIQAKDISSSLNMPSRTVDRMLERLRLSKAIERRGSRKTGGYWEVKR